MYDKFFYGRIIRANGRDGVEEGAERRAKKKKPERLTARAKSTPKEEGGGDVSNDSGQTCATQHDLQKNVFINQLID
ncbi:MAG TPA: hypothetical protein VJ673_21305 [Aromatoleum sp.]|uniref:hypothetical protein n=1 Tax=Aromatoleum sp. TaxID=2307007 RepID=UPI002B49252C|nr:hypothetical protein [Aromatoleum sp.]HJV28228.1 hypothetical protein [Aromatoleum sp.]